MNSKSNMIKLFLAVCLMFGTAEAILKDGGEPKNIDRHVAFDTELDVREYAKVARSNTEGISKLEIKKPYHHFTERIQIIDFLATNHIVQLPLTLISSADLVGFGFKNSCLSELVMPCEYEDGEIFLALKLRKGCGKRFTKYLDKILDPRGTKKSVAASMRDGEIIKMLMGDDELDRAVRTFLREIVCNTAVAYNLPFWKNGKVTSKPQTYILARDKKQVENTDENV